MSDYNSRIIRKYLKIRGFVQGVGFRYRTEHAANRVGATGWVRNDPDGEVSMEIQGIEAKTLPPVEEERGFRVRS